MGVGGGHCPPVQGQLWEGEVECLANQPAQGEVGGQVQDTAQAGPHLE